MQIVVQDLMTHYKSEGSGRVILMLHGWGDSLDTFSGLLSGLKHNFEIITLDLPGFGRTEPPKVAWNLDNYSIFLHDFLKKLNCPDIYAVIGHSNGGALAIRSVSMGQIKPKKLVLLSSSGVRDGQKLQKIGIKIIAKSGKVLTFWLPTSAKQKLRKKLYGTIGSDMLVAPHLQETFKQTVRQDVQTDARKIDMPTLLIYGNQDKATPLNSVGEPLHRQITNSKLEIIEGVDHFAHQTHSEQVQKIIMEFLA